MWPPSYGDVFRFRVEKLKAFHGSPAVLASAHAYYRNNPVDFINHWMSTVDPRNSGVEGKLSEMPFILFDKQKELIWFLDDLVANNVNGLVQKSRDMGATWVCCAYSVWLWLYYPGTAIGWGSRKAQLVDNLGDMSSIFEKIRSLIRGLPPCFTPHGLSPDNMPFMRIINPENESIITGEAGDNIGRGGRTKIFFKDESAHYERPELIEASLGDNTNCQVDISSVNGTGNVFYRKRKNGHLWVKGTVSKESTNIFVMSWRDHPLKTQEWYDQRLARHTSDGTLHIMAKEVDMDYSAAVEGVIISSTWVSAAVDAHLKLNIDANEGKNIVGYDVSDGGADKDAYALRKGITMRNLSHWGSADTGESCRKVTAVCNGLGEVSVQYDNIGIGSGVKSESTRLMAEGLLSPHVSFIPWNAAASPQDKDKPLDDNEGVGIKKKDVPTNGETYLNLKAQGWWRLRKRFEKTYKTVKGIEVFPSEELISLPSNLPFLDQLIEELSQPTYILTSNLKIKVDKQPEGTPSPNLADAVMMCYNPLPSKHKPVRAVRKPRLLL